MRKCENAKMLYVKGGWIWNGLARRATSVEGSTGLDGKRLGRCYLGCRVELDLARPARLAFADIWTFIIQDPSH